jgi:transcriptional regulator with XRE-family HTH domain
MPDGKSLNAIDVHVGERVRMQRLMIHMSQQTLAAGLGLTFQQIQKYEQGTNRIGASRLHQISEILAVPVSFLFEDLPGQNSRAGGQMPKYFVELMLTAQGQRLVAAFAKLTDKDVRSNVVELVESIVRLPRQCTIRAERGQQGLEGAMKNQSEKPVEYKCPKCNGTGFSPVVKQPRQPDRKIYPARCERCGGKGRTTESN